MADERTCRASDAGARAGRFLDPAPPCESSMPFDLLELNGTDMRREPIEVRKATLTSILRKAKPYGVRLNEHLEHPEGVVVFQHACKMGLEGIVSKRLGSHYRSVRSPDWLKFKNPEAPAVRREAEEDWTQMSRRKRITSGLTISPLGCHSAPQSEPAQTGT